MEKILENNRNRYRSPFYKEENCLYAEYLTVNLCCVIFKCDDKNCQNNRFIVVI